MITTSYEAKLIGISKIAAQNTLVNQVRHKLPIQNRCDFDREAEENIRN